MTRRVCILTGTRAEYGLLKGVIEGVREHPALDLSLIVTGSHMSAEHGLTVREIEADGVPIYERIAILDEGDGDGPAGVARAMGLALSSLGAAFARIEPDILVLLGDRYEILAAASAALVATIPVAHIAGGELTQGAIDDAIRHAVTKLSHLHFVATEQYRDRVVQLGEDPARVFVVGGPGSDALSTTPLLDRDQLEQSLDFRFLPRNLLVTFHPPTLDPGAAHTQMQAMLDALDDLDESTGLIFTMPNADAGGRALARQLETWVAGRTCARLYTSLGHQRYLSTMSVVDGVVGNSSSGLAEAPSFGIGTVNIGDRQGGRVRAPSVIDCAPERDAISAAIARLFSPEFQRIAQARVNPYGGGETAREIVRILVEHPLEGLVRKRFHDLPCSPA